MGVACSSPLPHPDRVSPSAVQVVTAAIVVLRMIIVHFPFLPWLTGAVNRVVVSLHMRAGCGADDVIESSGVGPVSWSRVSRNGLVWTVTGRELGRSGVSTCLMSS